MARRETKSRAGRSSLEALVYTCMHLKRRACDVGVPSHTYHVMWQGKSSAGAVTANQNPPTWPRFQSHGRSFQDACEAYKPGGVNLKSLSLAYVKLSIIHAGHFSRHSTTSWRFVPRHDRSRLKCCTYSRNTHERLRTRLRRSSSSSGNGQLVFSQAELPKPLPFLHSPDTHGGCPKSPSAQCRLQTHR